MKYLPFLVSFLLVSSIPALAQNATLAQPGLLPDHPFIGVQNLFEQIQLFLAFTPDAKANVHLQLADKRLAELSLAINENKTSLIPVLTNNFEKEVNDSESELNASQAIGTNTTELAQHVAEETFKHTLVLENVLQKVPDQAKSHIEHAINVSDTGHEDAVEHILEHGNVTGMVNITFTIGNQTFTQTFNITRENEKVHIENESEGKETSSQTTTESERTSSTTLVTSGRGSGSSESGH